MYRNNYIGSPLHNSLADETVKTVAISLGEDNKFNIHFNSNKTFTAEELVTTWGILTEWLVLRAVQISKETGDQAHAKYMLGELSKEIADLCSKADKELGLSND